MKNFDITIGIALLIFAIGALSSYISVKIYHRDDAPLEELAEKIVQETTGIDVDFTPGSPEVNAPEVIDAEAEEANPPESVS